MSRELDLYPHNRKALDSIIEKFDSGEDITCILHATGTGKTNIALGIACHYTNKKILFITRYDSILEHVKDVKAKTEEELDIKIDNMSFMTYSSLVNMTREELAMLDVDILIADEFHHVGAPVWQNRIETIKETHPSLKIVGMSAYSIRDRGTPYERDMAEPGGNELFSDKICSTYKLPEAILDGRLSLFRYKTVLVLLDEFINDIERKVKRKYKENTPLYGELIKKLNYFRSRLNLQDEMDELIKKNIHIGDKMIYFCPLGKDSDEINIDNIMSEMMEKLTSLGYDKDDIVFYKTTSKDSKNGKLNREAFYKDVDLSGEKVDKKLRIMFAINQYNEGVHVPGITGVILGRGTKSDIVFFEQIGRALAIRGDIKKEIDELNKYTMYELGEMAKSRGIFINSQCSKDDIIELLLAPTIIDLAGNFVYIRDLITDLRNEMATRKRENKDISSTLNITDLAFSTEVIGEEIFEILEKINKELMPKSFDEVFQLATNFYLYYGHLDIPRTFHTDDGIKFSQFGYSLGEWLAHIRHMKAKGELSVEQIEKMESIGVVWRKTRTFDEAYEIAKEYYEMYGNLNVPYNYKTEDGFNLGGWIVNLRSRRKKGLLSADKIARLDKIGMVWQVAQTFFESFELLKKYYNYYGNIDLENGFKTLDGINYNPEGFNLKKWLDNQRGSYHRGELSDEKIILLERLHINWGVKKENKVSWDHYYELAKNFYLHNHHLKISRSFKTFDGINYSEKGLNLGAWLSRQQMAKKKGKLTEEQIQLLDGIGMVWTEREPYKGFDEAYEIALEYYNKYGNLLVPVDYRTEDGYNLSSFLYQCRKKRESDLLSKEQIDKLDAIGMIWNINNNYAQIKEIMKENGLNPRKYSSLVRSLSVLEFRVKLKFIQDNGYSLVEDGKLNKIFIMNNQDFKMKYGVSIRELIDGIKDVRKK